MRLSAIMQWWIPLPGCALIACALAMPAGLAGAQSPPAPVPVATEAGAEAEEAVITIDNFTFAPSQLTVARGARVVWVNRDDIPHLIASADDLQAMRSLPLDTDDRFAFTFAKPGTYRYFCSLHPHMQGVVIVH
ncbi:MAG: cupredoxin family copper-binding protein [Acetobacteraceae bacterium]|nr:cupredoxin family copper-binding protein [Acetobacteraceae bacterium]